MLSAEEEGEGEVGEASCMVCMATYLCGEGPLAVEWFLEGELEGERRTSSPFDRASRHFGMWEMISAISWCWRLGGLGSGTAYKNVPPENSSSTPVHHLIPSSSAPPPPNVLTTTHVATAPAGAARLNTTRCARAPLFPSPCFNSTAVSPNAAGALCTIIATNIIRERDVVAELVEEAPRAMPSAAACIHSPRVVESVRCGCCCVRGELDERSESE